MPCAIPQLKLDCRINPAGMNIDMAFAIKTLEPFGQGNPTPVFGIFGVTLQKIIPIGNNKHLKRYAIKAAMFFKAYFSVLHLNSFAFV